MFRGPVTQHLIDYGQCPDGISLESSLCTICSRPECAASAHTSPPVPGQGGSTVRRFIAPLHSVRTRRTA